ncbi:pentatricopeptide repeat-containing protein At1g56690, mitochondrial-like [Ananas comosus]|uniref:Pentatricopeptide repeat-containing protein At1g56690, mitochondrial-like n=1 Tax=Ananas comosus TaxID=4615 RepID=A0A6P5F0K0_ANACO|nr:pentatricopeptide repeat-containing protein At1g56690, mitochondrial-like [Ananas comosus]
MRLPPIRFRAASTAAPVLAANTRIARLARGGDIAGARKVFDSMTERNVASYNSLISGYFLNRDPSLALALFHRMPLRTSASYNAAISGLARNRRLPDARALFDSMPLPLRNVVSYTSLLHGYVREGLLPEAESLFALMPERNVVSWTVMVEGLVRAGRVDDARRLFDEMPEKDVVARTAMIHGYCSCGRTAEARALFDAMPKRNVVSWTAMISGYVHNNQVDLARKLFEVMPERNEVSWTAMLTGYTQSGRIDEAADLFCAMPEHPLVACNAMILGFAQHRMVARAREVFYEMPHRDEGTWSAIVKAYEMNGLELDALSAFRSMQMNLVRPNFPAIISVLTVCASLAVLNHGREVHAAMLRSFFDDDVFAASALITMYIKCGNLSNAKRVFDTFGQKDVVMWNSMITGYAQHGLGEEALAIFDNMRSLQMVPDEITYIGVLSACSYTGKVKEGRKIFHSMSLNSSIKPKAEHYACMVDLLGRAGHVEEAMDLIRNMTVEADSVVWGALLGACRTHMNHEIAEIAAKKLLQLEPGNAGPYILLSNIYASSGRWREVTNLRKVMSSRNVSKSPGCSWIEYNKTVHMFTCGDILSHPENSIIIKMLEKLDRLLKEAGYTPDGSFVLHDVDEEQKAHNLLYHTERQAVAFGILKIPKGVPIRVMKNLRVCGDCHSTIKLIAKITGREIVLRDANRFHHFKDGVCSCRDYW